MPRKATGNVYFSLGRWYARVTLGPNERRSYPLPTCANEEQARERLAVLAELAAKLRDAGLGELAPEFLDRAAEREGRALDEVRKAVQKLCESGVANREPIAVSFREFAELWTSGKLAQRYPDHVKAKRTADTDTSRLEAHVYPIAGHVPLVAFTLDHALAVMSALPAHLSAASRRHVAQLISRILALATFPARLIPGNPLPRGFLPRMGPEKAKGWLYPDEDALLLACPAVPLPWRVFYGFLNREGPRSSEALGLQFRDLDIVRGTLTLDENKTDDPRAWALNSSVVAALRAWKATREEREGRSLDESAPVFVDGEGQPIPHRHLAERFREHLQAAGITRPILFEQSAARQKIRLHDTRATFITLALANGRTEAWVQDRTGHKSSLMINRYRRAARTAAELGLGDLLPLDIAIPELAEPPEGEKAGEKAGERALTPQRSPSAPPNPQHFRLVAPVGVEPTHPCGPWILKPVMVVARMRLWSRARGFWGMVATKPRRSRPAPPFPRGYPPFQPVGEGPALPRRGRRCSRP
jgi:integrase